MLVINSSHSNVFSKLQVDLLKCVFSETGLCFVLYKFWIFFERENKVGSNYEVLCASRFISIGVAGLEIARDGTRPWSEDDNSSKFGSCYDAEKQDWRRVTCFVSLNGTQRGRNSMTFCSDCTVFTQVRWTEVYKFSLLLCKMFHSYLKIKKKINCYVP
jgi:hypothetical protein